MTGEPFTLGFRRCTFRDGFTTPSVLPGESPEQAGHRITAELGGRFGVERDPIDGRLRVWIIGAEPKRASATR